jgi:serine/threonine-protein kinase HipA
LKAVIDERKLFVWFEKKVIGELESVNGIWSFYYSQSWLDDDSSFPLCPDIGFSSKRHTDNSTNRYVQWFFDNLLPEENARAIIAKDKNVDKEDAFSLLELYGAESAGALTILKKHEGWSEGSVEPLPKTDLSFRINHLATSPLSKGAKKKMSLAGAQHKVAIIYDKGELLEPLGAMPSSHILKPQHEHPSEYWATVCNEWFVMTLAGKLGLQVPLVNIEYVPEPVFIIERFDRDGIYPNQTRKHIVDACQLKGLYSGSKYRLSNVNTICTLLELVDEKALTRLRLFKWVLFNALVGNGDAHLKNLSFYVRPHGYTLTEHYDLLSTIIYRGKTALDCELSQKIGNATYFRQLAKADLISFAQVIGLPEKIAVNEINKMTRKIVIEFDHLYKIVENGPDSVNKLGDLRVLREIRHLVLLEMVSKVT